MDSSTRAKVHRKRKKDGCSNSIRRSHRANRKNHVAQQLRLEHEKRIMETAEWKSEERRKRSERRAREAQEEDERWDEGEENGEDIDQYDGEEEEEEEDEDEEDEEGTDDAEDAETAEAAEGKVKNHQQHVTEAPNNARRSIGPFSAESANAESARQEEPIWGHQTTYCANFMEGHLSDEDCTLDPKILRKLGFAKPSRVSPKVLPQKFPIRLPIWRPGSDQIVYEPVPRHVKKQVAECSVGSDLTVTFDSKGLPSLDRDFVEKRFKYYDLNHGVRKIPYERDACFQLALDAAARAKPNFLEGRSVVAMRGCLTSLIEPLLDQYKCPALNVYRLGTTLLIAKSSSEGSDEVPPNVAYRGHRFEALCTGKDLPSSGQCPHYYQVLDTEFGSLHKLIVVAEVDAKDEEQMLEVKLMHTPRYSSRHAIRRSLLRIWLQACFSTHDRFVIGLHEKHFVEKFLQSRRPPTHCANICSRSDVNSMLDEHLTRELGKDLELWHPRVLFGWFGTILKFLQKNTRSGCAYTFERPCMEPNTQGETQGGEGCLVLDESNELWKDCPDVFSWPLRKLLSDESIFRRLGSFLRVPILLNAQTSTDASDGNMEIVLLDFSRNPQKFKDALLHCPALCECRVALRRMGYSVEQPSGSHIYVCPSIFEATLVAIRREQWDLQKRHVVVSHELETRVMDAVQKLPSKLQVRLKNRQTVRFDTSRTARSDSSDDEVKPEESRTEPAESHGDMETAQNTDQVEVRIGRPCPFPIVVKRTFLHVDVAESIYSGPSSGQKIASTTDANPRVGVRPRKGFKAA